MSTAREQISNHLWQLRARELYAALRLYSRPSGMLTGDPAGFTLADVRAVRIILQLVSEGYC